MSYINNKGLWGFVGGVIAAAIGTKVVKSPATRKLAVQGLSKAMLIQQKAMEQLANIREEAQAGTVTISLFIIILGQSVSFSAGGTGSLQRGKRTEKGVSPFFIFPNRCTIRLSTIRPAGSGCAAAAACSTMTRPAALNAGS